MTQSNKQPQIRTLAHPPDIIIWYCPIEEILEAVLDTDFFHTPKKMINEVFHEKDFRYFFLAPDELKTINGFKAMKKQKEWLCGRYLAKGLAQKFFLIHESLEKITLSILPEGAPYIAQRPDIPLSISHSGKYAVCAVSLDPGRIIGIDLEKSDKAPGEDFMKLAFTPAEIKEIQTSEDLFKKWTLKEAYLKFIKKGFNESLHHVEVLNGQIYHHKNKIPLDTRCEKIAPNYLLSIVSTL